MSSLKLENLTATLPLLNLYLIHRNGRGFAASVHVCASAHALAWAPIEALTFGFTLNISQLVKGDIYTFKDKRKDLTLLSLMQDNEGLSVKSKLAQ